MNKITVNYIDAINNKFHVWGNMLALNLGSTENDLGLIWECIPMWRHVRGTRVNTRESITEYPYTDDNISHYLNIAMLNICTGVLQYGNY